MATNTELDENFIAKQKERLQSLRDELLRILRAAEEDERSRTEQDADFTEHDAGDMSRDISTARSTLPSSSRSSSGSRLSRGRCKR